MRGELTSVRGAVALASARGVWSERAALLVTVRTADAWGQGECAPLPGYSADTLEGCQAALATLDWAAFAAVATLADLTQRLDAARLPAAARCAVEAAVLDWLARRHAVPVWRLLGGAPGELALSALVDDAAAVAAAAARGVRTAKIKVGRPDGWARELALARAVRAAGLALRIDANGAWSPALAERRLAELVPLEPELVEEPVAGGLMSAPPFASHGLRLAADESLLACLPPSGGAPRADLAGPRPAVIVLKPMLLGGIGNCLALAAALPGADLVVSHTWDGPLGLATAAALAFALPRARLLPPGLDRHAALAAYPDVSLPFLHGATLTAPTSPGLGLTEVRA